MEDIQLDKVKFCIVGAGGFGVELESWISGSQEFRKKHELIGYLDTNTAVFEKVKNGYQVIGVGSKDDFLKYKNIILGIADCHVKVKIHNLMQSIDLQFMSFKHDSVLIGRQTIIGEGAVFCPYTVVSSNSVVGNCFLLNIGSQVGHDCVIGDYVSIMAGVVIGGGAKIGNKVFIGSNATILPGVSIPDNTVIGAGSVVIKNIKQSGSYFGNPAKKIF